MNTRLNEKLENKSSVVAANFPTQQSSGNAALGYIDNRQEAVAQRKLQEAITNSPRVKQSAIYQKEADGKGEVTQQKAYQAMANNSASKTANQKENLEAETVEEKFSPVQKKENETGLPVDLRTGIENLSGYSLEDVKVHYNSGKPSQLQAHAYTHGSDIHLASGQEKHLPHEAWHVVQQKQGRVQPTMRLDDKVNVNDDAELEKEADLMGAKAIQRKAVGSSPAPTLPISSSQSVYQFKGKDALRYAQLNELAEDDFFRTPGQKRKPSLTRGEVLSILNNKDISLEKREGLRAAWNTGLSGSRRIEVTETKYRKLLERKQKEHMDKYKRGAKLDKVNEYDSDKEDSSIGVTQEIMEMFKSAKPATVVTLDGAESEAYIFSPAEGVKVLRKIRKFGLFKNFPGIHLIFQVGRFWQLYTAPRGNDFAYAPVLEVGPSKFQRGGNIDSWHSIAQALTDELKKIKDNSFKGQVERIITTFNGGQGPLTEGESHAVGAILCDYAAGVRGTLHYLERLAAAVQMEQVTDHMTAWTGSKPHYAPAAIGGRPLVGAEKIRGSASSAMDEEKKAPVVDQVKVGGRRYAVNVEGVRSTGECFWDTLRYYEIDNADINAAAATAGLRVDQHVMADQIEAFFNALSVRTGNTYRVNLDMINILNLLPINSSVIGDGTTTINIGFFINPRDRQGHYVPSI